MIMREVISRCCLVAVCLCPPLLPARAQTPPSSQPDPTTALLMAQPQIDTTSPVTAEATFDPPIVRPGDTTTYRVTFSAMMDSIAWPDEVIAPEALEMQPGARGQMFVPVAGRLQPRSTINTRARTTVPGTFTVPRFMVYVYGKPVTVPEAQLVVTADPAIPVPSAPEVQLELSCTNPFVGQTVRAKVTLPGTPEGLIQALTMIKLSGEGFITDPMSARQRVEALTSATNSRAAFIYEIDITPIEPKPIEIAAQGFTAGNQFSGPITITGRATIPGGPPQYLLLDTPPVVMTVRPLPTEGRLPGYNGAIGQFRLGVPVLATNKLKVGDPLTYSINILGNGNLARLVPPPPPHVPGWQAFAGAADKAPPALVAARGFITFSYTFIPTSEESRTTPEVPFSYFDPESGAYMNLSLPAVAVTVTPGTAPVDAEALKLAAVSESFREKEPQLSGLATAPGQSMSSLVPLQNRSWFPGLQLAPALAFAGLWWWDRRRRYYEAHPDILVRRRARRALHREWAALRKAANLGDTPRFAACGVSAMRVACAPHYPAEPRALVSCDVLPLLPEPTGPASDAVRRIFAAADADRFAAEPANAKDLLTLRRDLDRVLAQLEEKLR